MAWIEDADRSVLLVHQAGGLKFWTLPGGKVKPGESLVKGLKRKETGLRVQIGSLLGVLDRQDKDAITLLFAAIPRNQSIVIRLKQSEIKKAAFQAFLPNKASPSAKYFWSIRKSAINSAPLLILIRTEEWDALPGTYNILVGGSSQNTPLHGHLSNRSLPRNHSLSKTL